MATNSLQYSPTRTQNINGKTIVTWRDELTAEYGLRVDYGKSQMFSTEAERDMAIDAVVNPMPAPLAGAWADFMDEADKYFEYLAARTNNPKYSHSKVKWQETVLKTRIGHVLAVQRTYGLTA